MKWATILILIQVCSLLVPSCSFFCCFLLLETKNIKSDHSWFCWKFCQLSQLQCSCSTISPFECEYQPLKVWLKEDSRVILIETLAHPNHWFLCSRPLPEQFHKLSCFHRISSSRQYIVRQPSKSWDSPPSLSGQVLVHKETPQNSEKRPRHRSTHLLRWVLKSMLVNTQKISNTILDHAEQRRGLLLRPGFPSLG